MAVLENKPLFSLMQFQLYCSEILLDPICLFKKLYVGGPQQFK